MQNEARIQDSVLDPAPAQPATEQIRDARDLLTRLYREIGISAVAAALEVRRDKTVPSRPPVAVLHNGPPASEHDRAA